MSSLLLQIVLAQRRFDDEGWMNILVVIVMAVIWMVASVVKAMKAKSDQEQPSQEPTRKPPAHGRGAHQRTPGQAQRPAGPSRHATRPSAPPQRRITLADLREAARKFAAEAERAFQPETTAPAPTPPRPAQMTQASPDLSPAIASAPRSAEQVVATQKADAQMQPAHQLADLLTDYADPAKLRQAILHYEILGPPLSLRD